MKNIYLLLLSAFFILGCSNTPTITPDNLPKASVGKPYNVKIEIEKLYWLMTYLLIAISLMILVWF